MASSRKSAAPKKGAAASSTRKKPKPTPKPPAPPASEPEDSADKPLHPRHQRFVVEYLKDRKAGAAYQRAGYSATGNAAEVSGCRLLRNAQIAQAIAAAEAELIATVQEETGISLARVLREIAKGAFFDPRKMFSEYGNALSVPGLGDDEATALAGFEVTEEKDHEGAVIGHTKKFKLADRKGYLDMLMRHLGGYKVDHDQQKPELVEQLAQFMGELHQSGAGRLPIAKRNPIAPPAAPAGVRLPIAATKPKSWKA